MVQKTMSTIFRCISCNFKLGQVKSKEKEDGTPKLLQDPDQKPTLVYIASLEVLRGMEGQVSDERTRPNVFPDF